MTTYNEWLVEDSNDDGSWFEYMLQAPNAFWNHDDGALKVRRRCTINTVHGEKAFSTHGKRYTVPESIIEGAASALTTYVDELVTSFRQNHESYPMNWGRYSE